MSSQFANHLNNLESSLEDRRFLPGAAR